MKFIKRDYNNETIKNLDQADSSIHDIDFEDCRFVDCRFVNCNISKCKFINCQFRDCVLSALIPTDSHFVDVKFKECKVTGVDWTKAQRVQGLSFELSVLDFSNFSLIKVPNTTILDCQAHEVDFIETDLSGSTLTGNDFDKSVFAKTNLSKTDLRGSKNYYINPVSNNIKGAKFSLPEAISLLRTFSVTVE